MTVSGLPPAVVHVWAMPKATLALIVPPAPPTMVMPLAPPMVSRPLPLIVTLLAGPGCRCRWSGY